MTGDIAPWNSEKACPEGPGYPDHVAAATAGGRGATGPETRWSNQPRVGVNAGESRPCRDTDEAAKGKKHAIRADPGICGTRLKESQSSQANGSASGRDDIGPDLLQRYDVTGLGG